jgi:LysM repeat protein
MFRAVDPIDQQIQLDYAGNDATSAQQRATLQSQREQAIKDALGPERYPLYRMAKDPVYKDAVATVQNAGGPPGAVSSVYAVYQTTAQELDRIRNDGTLSQDQKDEQTKSAQAEQKLATDKLLGLAPPEPPAPPPPAPLPTHSFSPGETVDYLATKYGTTSQAIMQANPNLNFELLTKGATINIPPPPSK